MVALSVTPSVLTTLLLSLPLTVSVSAHSDHGRAAYARNLAIEKRHHAQHRHRALAAALTATVTSPASVVTPTAPPLSQISSGMPTEVLYSMFTTFTPGASPPISATPLPSATVNSAIYPTPDVIPPTTAPQIQHWIQAVQAANIPNNPQTKDGTCDSDPGLIPNAGANGTCWWTCGGCTRDTDIVSCPDKLTYGVSYDDGPTIYTPKLLDYLNDVGVKATFFVVGSRAFYAPALLQAEYMLGHSVSVHTWSHPALTSLTNEQIAAELGWTMIVMKEILGVTPNTFRPPYGDIDDRVRAVAKVMGLTPIIWTGDGDLEFDTEDWKVAQGTQTSSGSLAAWEKILDLATSISTGFIVLSHDLYQVTVDLAVSAFLPLALSNTDITLQPIHECLHVPLGNFYMETFVNSTTSGTTTTGTALHTGSSSQKPTGTSSQSPASKSSGATSSLKGTVGLGLGSAVSVTISAGLMFYGGMIMI